MATKTYIRSGICCVSCCSYHPGKKEQGIHVHLETTEDRRDMRCPSCGHVYARSF